MDRTKRIPSRGRRTLTLILAGLATIPILAGAPTPAQAHFTNPAISCQADPADEISYSHQYSEGESYWAWSARTGVVCHWFSPRSEAYDYQVKVVVTLHRANDSVGRLGTVESGIATGTLHPGEVQQVITSLSASYFWTGCSSSEQYVIRTEAYYRFKPAASSSWTPFDTYQEHSMPTGNLQLCSDSTPHDPVIVPGGGGGGGGGSVPANSYATAFQANTTNLWTAGTSGVSDWSQGMMAGTSPSIAALYGGGEEIAFQANTGNLITMSSAGNFPWQLGMAPGTSPSITGLAGGGFEVAFQANTGNLWTIGDAGWNDWGLGMAAGTSPSIAALPGGGFEVAFQANTSNLWTIGDAGWNDWGLGMAAGTSPSITTLPGNGFEVAFQANTSNLWTIGDAGWNDWGLGMRSGTSPSIVGLSNGGFEVAFQANTSNLWSVGDAGNRDWGLGMMAGTSPSIAR